MRIAAYLYLYPGDLQHIHHVGWFRYRIAVLTRSAKCCWVTGNGHFAGLIWMHELAANAKLGSWADEHCNACRNGALRRTRPEWPRRYAIYAEAYVIQSLRNPRRPQINL